MLSVITIDESQQWNDIVRSFNEYDVYYLAEYVKSFQMHGDGNPILFYYNDNKVRAMNVVMKRDIASFEYFTDSLPRNTYFDITTPYGYGGFIIEGDKSVENIKYINDIYSKYCKSNNIVSEFVRFHPIIKNHIDLEYLYDIEQLGKTVSIDLNTPEQIWNDFTSKNRNKVRKAVKSGVEIFWGRSPDLYKKFIELYNATMDRDNADDYYYFGKDFFRSVMNDLKYDSIIFYATLDGQIIAMSIILYANRQLHYHLSASDRNYLHVAPTNLLLYEVAYWGCMNGFKTFHLGGGLGSKEDSLYKFKKAFNRNTDNMYNIGKKIFDKDMYNELVDLRFRNDIVNTYDESFFPKYRAT